MKSLDEILSDWAEDCKINEMHLDESSRLSPMLHAKYLELLSNYKLMLKRAEFKQKELLKDKWLYYEGKMSQEDIDARGWSYDPYNGLNIRTKQEKEYYYGSDNDIQKSEEKIEYYKTVVETLTEIIDNIKWRHQTIGNIIKWRQFESGS